VPVSILRVGTEGRRLNSTATIERSLCDRERLGACGSSASSVA
jgi:hypothetical protein